MDVAGHFLLSSTIVAFGGSEAIPDGISLSAGLNVRENDF
jgi:hypothetical protein